MTSKESKEALKSGKVVQPEKAKAFVGDFAFFLDEWKFSIGMESQRNIILLEGMLVDEDAKGYRAKVLKVVVGYTK